MKRTRVLSTKSSMFRGRKGRLEVVALIDPDNLPDNAPDGEEFDNAVRPELPSVPNRSSDSGSSNSGGDCGIPSPQTPKATQEGTQDQGAEASQVEYVRKVRR